MLLNCKAICPITIVFTYQLWLYKSFWLFILCINNMHTDMSHSYNCWNTQSIKHLSVWRSSLIMLFKCFSWCRVDTHILPLVYARTQGWIFTLLFLWNLQAFSITRYTWYIQNCNLCLWCVICAAIELSLTSNPT